MGELIDPGRKQPNGSKIVELRKRNGMKQETLAKDADISVRLLRDIEKKIIRSPQLRSPLSRLH